MGKVKRIKPPCGHSREVTGTAWGKPWDCVTPWPGTSLGVCSACGAQMQRLDYTDDAGTAHNSWQAIPRRRVVRKRGRAPGAVCLPLCSDAELLASEALAEGVAP